MGFGIEFILTFVLSAALLFCVGGFRRRWFGSAQGSLNQPETSSLRQVFEVFEKSVDAVLYVDTNARVQYLNAACERLFRYTQDEIKGQGLQELLLRRGQEETDVEGWAYHLSHHLKLSRSFVLGADGVIEGCSRFGERFPLAVSVTALFTGTQEKGYLLILRDQSHELQKIERLENALAESERLSQSRSSFLANLTHEIRTPMNTIVGITDLLQESGLNDEQKGLVETLGKAEEALLTLVNDVLDISKIQSGNFGLRNSCFVFGDVFKSVYNILVPTADKKGLRLALDVSDIETAEVLGDPIRLRQILLNLVGNAIKFSDKGEVWIRARCESRKSDVCALLLSVEDQGLGISPADQSLIFEQYRQTDKGAQHFGGTGLGLAISKKLVEMMNGEIWVESEEGKGAKFFVRLRLPLADMSKVNAASAKPISLSSSQLSQTSAVSQVTENEAGHMPKLSILLVDDVQDNLFLLRKYFNKTAHEFTEAADGQQALEYAKERNFDLIFMDIQMPIMDGYEAIREIRRWERSVGREPSYIIALSAHALIEAKEASFAAGANLYMVKPVRKQQILQLVNNLALEFSQDDSMQEERFYDS